MRLSSVQIFQQGISGILDQQSKLAKTEQQLATGKRIQVPSDDPVAAVQILNLNEDMALLDQYQRNGNLAEGQLALEDTVLANVGNVLQRVRELVVQANNASQSVETRRSASVEIEGLLEQLQSLANTRDSEGEYIFAGFQADSVPFTRQNGQYAYQGDDGKRFLQLGKSSQVAVRDSGFNVFMAVPTGNGRFDVIPDATNAGTGVIGSATVDGSFVRDTYSITFSQALPGDPVTYEVRDSSNALLTSGNYQGGDEINFAGASIQVGGLPVDGDRFEVFPAAREGMFASIQAIADSLASAIDSPAGVASVNNAMGRGLNNLDQAIGHMLAVRADVGVRLNQVENQQSLNEDFNLQLEQTLSSVQDLDYAQAISELNLQLTALQAAQQAYVKVQGLSLFNYL
ncbi:MAG: flagellar hook-associated protein FlgL [Porticoccus sp.]|uniref:flagellar hook-associated protein FlgL n=1 Tax=Porticoccus sp. TaxID=2024853 RepID=UPI003299F2DD